MNKHCTSGGYSNYSYVATPDQQAGWNRTKAIDENGPVLIVGILVMVVCAFVIILQIKTLSKQHTFEAIMIIIMGFIASITAAAIGVAVRELLK